MAGSREAGVWFADDESTTRVERGLEFDVLRSFPYKLTSSISMKIKSKSSVSL